MVPPDLLALRQTAHAHQMTFQHALEAWTAARMDPQLHASLPRFGADCHTAGALYQTALDQLIARLQADAGDDTRDAERGRAQRMRALLQRELAIVDRGS